MQQFQLTIPEPCHQSWQQMTPTQQGRFCSACAKEVIDFSTMSDHEVLNYFNNLKHENVCGRVLPSQLERTIAVPNEPVKKRFWYWNYITMCFLLFSKNSAAHKPHGGISITKFNLNTLNDFSTDLITQKISKQKIWVTKIIRGKITDENGRGIPFVTINVKGTNRLFQSDANGVFSIKVNPATEVLELSASGYSKGIYMLAGLSNYDFTLSSSGRDIIIFAGKMIKRPVPEKKPVSFMPVKISGNIINQKGDIIPYASIKVFDSYSGISADSAGKFSIIVNDINSKLEISAAGYTTKTIEASLTDQFKNIVLEQSINQTLEPLVVTGYETKRVSCISGAVASVKGEMLATTVIKKNSFTQALKQILPFKTNEVRIYPSPVTRGSSFSVSVSSFQTGDHNVQVIDALGRVLLNEQVTLNANQQTIQLHCDEKWSAGIYFIRVFNTNNRLLSTNSFSIQ